MKTYREKFEEDYIPVQVPCRNRRGYKIQYEYIGIWYIWEASAERISLVRRVSLLCMILSFSSFLLGALVSSPLTWDRWVSLMTGLSLAAMVFECVGVIQFVTAGECLPRQYFTDVNTKMRIAPLAHACLMFGAAAAAMPVLFQMGRAAQTMEIMVPLCFLMSAVTALIIWRQYRSLPQGKRKNEKELPSGGALRAP